MIGFRARGRLELTDLGAIWTGVQYWIYTLRCYCDFADLWKIPSAAGPRKGVIRL